MADTGASVFKYPGPGTLTNPGGNPSIIPGKGALVDPGANGRTRDTLICGVSSTGPTHPFWDPFSAAASEFFFIFEGSSSKTARAPKRMNQRPASFSVVFLLAMTQTLTLT